MYSKAEFFVFVVVTMLTTFRCSDASTDSIDLSDEWGQTSCLYTNGNESVLNTDISLPSVLQVDSNGTNIVTKCQFCFSLWKEDSDLSVNILSQGCWLSSDGCSQSRCVMQGSAANSARNQAKGSDEVKFCCCSGDACNGDISTNLTQLVLVEDQTESQLTLDSFEDEGSIDPIFLGLMTFLAASLIGLMCLSLSFWMRWRRQTRKRLSFMTDFESCNESESKTNANNFDLNSLMMDNNNVIGQGKYGVVYKAQLLQIDTNTLTTVAVKVFSSSQKKAFVEEREVYELSRHANPSVTSSFLKYFGSLEAASLNDVIYDSILVVSYAEQGSLLSFLKAQTVSWPELCRMLRDIAHGLSALHSGFEESGSKNRPSICHRDLNSRNILVRSDLRCCIADFGFSIQIRGSTYYQNSLELSAESGYLSDVGTVRYLAPELLEGALNLRDCESALKQADVYALGLVFWELSRRCRDLYQGANVGNYEQAYERELGCLCPGFEQMKNLVARNRARPLFPEIWKKCNPAIHQLRETVEDSWDHDGEARLTASCVLERVNQLPVMWDWYKLNSQGPPSIESVLPNASTMTSPTHDTNVNHVSNELTLKIVNQTSPSIDDPKVGTDAPSNVGFSGDADKKVQIKIDNVLSRQQTVAKIQPYQGRNLCLERNLMNDIDESESSPLIQKSTKDLTTSILVQNDVRQNDVRSSEVTSHLGQVSRLLPHQNAIPYVKNDFSSPESRREKNTTNLSATSQQNISWFRKPKNCEHSGNPAAINNKPQNGESNLIPSTQNELKSQTKALNAVPASKMS